MLTFDDSFLISCHSFLNQPAILCYTVEGFLPNFLERKQQQKMITACIKSQLRALQERLARECEGFPENCCNIASEAVEKIFGLPILAGIFTDDNGRQFHHAWNISPDGQEYIDLTAHQFSGDFKDTIIIDASSEFAENHYLTGFLGL